MPQKNKENRPVLAQVMQEIPEGLDGQPSDNQLLTRRFEIVNQRGLHARASAKLVRCAEQFDAAVSVELDGQTVPGTSIMGLMMLAAHKGTIVTCSATGPQAAEALDEIGALIAQKFGEE